MPRGHTFGTVEAIARTLPGAEVTTAWGQPALKVQGKMLAGALAIMAHVAERA